ncbi:MAG: acyl-ACP--UDP-N-acetylglucosamine O-acyltransferase [Acidobacteria bacterium]|nr:acyl-ACP--UDP-N-acetylglucosamine O-acyltransferase [Acidobacteriota bacterium]
MTEVHPTTLVSGEVDIAEGVRVGPFTEIMGPVRIGEGTCIDGHCRIEGPVEIGKHNRIHAFCSLGTPPQDLKYGGEPTRLVIGDHNTIREFSTFNRGTVGGGGITTVGSRCLFMAYSHVAHDCHVEDFVIFANAGTLAGHVHVGHHATIGGFSAVHQFCRVGPYAFVGGFAALTRDVLPYMKTLGIRNGSRTYGPNLIGLRRQGFSEERLDALKKAYRVLFRQTDKVKNLSLALKELEETVPLTEDVRLLVDFIRSSKRGVIR